MKFISDDKLIISWKLLVDNICEDLFLVFDNKLKFSHIIL